jgi:hypothetical protein
LVPPFCKAVPPIRPSFTATKHEVLSIREGHSDLDGRPLAETSIGKFGFLERNTPVDNVTAMLTAAADEDAYCQQQNHGCGEFPQPQHQLKIRLTLLPAVQSIVFAQSSGLSAFDNTVGRGKWTPEQQARTLKELGYDGISYNYTNPKDLAVWIESCRRHGIKLQGLHVHTFPDQDPPFDPAFKEAIPLLMRTGCVIWMTLLAAKDKSRNHPPHPPPRVARAPVGRAPARVRRKRTIRLSQPHPEHSPLSFRTSFPEAQSPCNRL